MKCIQCIKNDVDPRHPFVLKVNIFCTDLHVNDCICTLTEVRIPYDETGQTAYEKACTRFGALPASCFTRTLTSKSATEIDMKYYGMGPKEAMAISIPMLVRTEARLFIACF